jgi:uncharacterized repeat protein (TIGR02543 family)
MANITAEKDIPVTLPACTFTGNFGMVFTGWNTKANGSGTSYADGATVTNLASVGETVTLYAQWRFSVDDPTSCTIRFNANGGAGTMTDQEFYILINLRPNKFTREGYVFTGWNTKADGSGTSYADGATVTNLASPGETVTLYAQWELGYGIHFEANGGEGTMTIVTAEKDKPVTLPACTFTGNFGMVFTEWNTKADGSGTSYADGATVTNLASPGETVTLYAQWAMPQLNAYTIHFNANGGTGTMSNQIIELVTAADVLFANRFTRDGYAFAGWNTKADGSGTSYGDGAQIFTRDLDLGGIVTLYAQWKLGYGIRFDANGGWGNMASVTAKKDEPVTLPACTFGKTVRFLNWNTKADGSGTSYADGATVTNLASPGETVTLYAQWSDGSLIIHINENYYLVHFDANGGTGTMADQQFNLSERKALTDNSFTREGYVFTGWNTESDGSGTSYADGAIVIDLASLGETVTLYAQWEVGYAVHFDANGGKGTMDDQMVGVGRTKALSANKFTREGYTFAGWNTKSDDSGTSYADGATVTDLA